ncbi:MAG: hypothetical protein IPM38_11655 [Ignavibacteria bacterium]|nr:hypothetical protein [Ignavibacteria bacterium]
MSKYISGFLFFMIIVIAGCSGNKVNRKDNNISKGKYDFTMYDSNNVIIAEGLLIINDHSGNVISGNYNFTKVTSEFNGYGTMDKGKFTGKINQKEENLLLNTNPGQADRNVYFNFDIGKTPVSGIWYYSAFRNSSKPCKITLTMK